jgi:hypothetical protein
MGVAHASEKASANGRITLARDVPMGFMADLLPTDDGLRRHRIGVSYTAWT